MPNDTITNRDATSTHSDTEASPQQPKKAGKMVRQKPYLIAVILLTVLAIAGISFGATGFVLNTQMRAQIADLEAKQDDNDVLDNLEAVEEGEELASEQQGNMAKNLLIRGNKLINKSDDPVAFSLVSGDGTFSVELRAEEAGLPNCDTGGTRETDEYNIVVGVNYDAIEEGHWFEKKLNKTGYEEIKVTDVDASHVVDVKLGEFGHGPGGLTILILMDDGTVEYIPVEKALSSGFRSYGKINGVEGIIGLHAVELNEGCTGGRDMIAQKANGEFYELFKILEDQGAWK